MADFADFLGGAAIGAGHEFLRQRRALTEEEKEKRKLYLRLIMSGRYTEAEARAIVGYKGGTGQEAQAVKSALSRAKEEEEAQAWQDVEQKAREKKPFEALAHRESPYALERTTKGIMGAPLAIPKEETFAERIARKERLAAEEELKEEKGKRAFEMEKITTRHELSKKLEAYKAGLKSKDEKEDAVTTKWRSTVDAIVRYNETHPDLEYPVVAPSLEEYRSNYREGGFSKKEALIVFRDMKNAGMSQEDMLEMFNKNQGQLLIDGVDLESLMVKIMGYKK